MNDENFDKIFGDKLKTGKDFSFTDAKWQKMEKRLDSFIAERRQQRRWLWLAAPLLACLGLLGWGGWALYSAQKDMRDLTEEVKILRQQKQTDVGFQISDVGHVQPKSLSVVKNDTVVHHVVIKRYDTIFQTVVQHINAIEAVIPNHPLNNALRKNEVTVMTTPLSITGVQEEKIKKIEENQTIETTTNSVNPIAGNGFKIVEKSISIEKKAEKGNFNAASNAHEANVAQKSKRDSTETIEPPVEEVILNRPINNATITAADSLKMVESNASKNIVEQKTGDVPPLPKESGSAISIVDRKQVKTADIPEESSTNKLEAKPLSIIKPMKKMGFEIGFSSGLAVANDENVVQQSDFTIGVKGGILLGKRLKIVGEAEFLGLDYEIEKLNNRRDIPNITPPTPNDEFKQVQVQQSYTRYSLGLQYVLLQKRLKPYLGLGLLGQSKIDEKLVYQFKNRLTNEPVFVRTMRDENHFEFPLLRFQVGAEYPILKKFKAQLEGSYDFNLGHTPQYPSLFQLKAAVLYHF